MPTALVTGASAGIGRALALRFAAGGYDLAVTARRPAELAALAAEVTRLGRACHTFPADLSDPAAPPDLWRAVAVSAAPDRYFRLDAGATSCVSEPAVTARCRRRSSTPCLSDRP